MKKSMLCGLGISVFMVAVVFVSASAQAAETIKIGVCEPLSGTFKDIGERYLEGVEYAVKVINEQGGLLGRKVEVIPIDSELKPDVASRKATKLILKDNVRYFCGGTGSSVGGAMSVLAEKNNALMLSYGMAAASLTGEKCSRNFFRACLNTDTQSYALAMWVANSGYKKVLGIAQDYSFGHEAVEAFMKKVKELNPSIEIVGKLFHKAGEKDFAPYVSQIISSGAEVVWTPNWGNDLTLLIKQGKNLGMKAKIASYFLNDEYLIESVADDSAIIGNVTAEAYMLTIPGEENRKFIEGFYKDKGYYPSWLRGKAYTATMFWAEALKKAGKDDTNAVIKAWEGLTYEGPAGTWYMRPCDHQAQIPVWVAIMVKDSEFYKHAFVGKPTMIPAKDIEITCEETGCKMK
ncbi:MAG: ABC transporter substrate-binding protein [Deltaproteobacteria bacterium]|nr:MAG: ABC transporter substrate-binding protein [Deltaproteobacteria bacterium]